MINAHLNALNRAYALIDNKIDGLSSEAEMRSFLDAIEAQTCEPMMDLVYIHAFETVKQKLKGLKNG
jgi:hypothetical protein